MKALLAGVISVAAFAGQTPRVAPARGTLGVVTVGITQNALGGRYVPTTLTNPLGGIGSSGGGKRSKTATGSRYIGPVYYVPNAYDTTPYSTPYGASSYGDPSGNTAQPIVVNQYFLTKGSSLPDMAQPDPSQAEAEAPPNPGDPLVQPASYYLIAYKDRSIYSALAYWVEGDTLHYVTTQNTHNQASLSLIDTDRTYKLNADQSVPFSIPGK